MVIEDKNLFTEIIEENENEKADISAMNPYKITSPKDHEMVSWCEGDPFYTDLNHLTDKELLKLAYDSKFSSPSYFLSKRYSSTSALLRCDDDTLLKLAEAGVNKAIDAYLERYDYSPYRIPSDEMVVYLAKEGGQDALDEIAYRMQPNINYLTKHFFKSYYYLKYLGYDFDDLYQEANLSLMNSIKDYNIEKKKMFKYFFRYVLELHIKTILSNANNTRNTSLNYSHSFNAPVQSDSEFTYEHMLEGNSENPEDAVCDREHFQNLFNNLSEYEQQVVLLKSEKYTYEEIAELLNKKTKSIDNTSQRTRIKSEKYEKHLLDG